MNRDLAIILVLSVFVFGFVLGMIYHAGSLHEINRELSEEEHETVCSCLIPVIGVAAGISIVLFFIVIVLHVIKKWEKQKGYRK